MISVTATFKSAKDFVHYSVPIETHTTEMDFEKAFNEAWHQYESFPFEVLVYIDDDSAFSLSNDEGCFAQNESLKSLKSRCIGEMDYNPSLPECVDEASVLRVTSPHFAEKKFAWKKVGDFALEKLVVLYKNDQNGKPFFVGFEYDGEIPDEETDFDYDGWYDYWFEFFYHPNQEWES